MRIRFPVILLLLAAPLATAASRYPITPQAGPYVILVTCYEGDDSAKLAEELCEGIRRDYRLNAYVYDRGAEKKKQEEERVRDVRKKQVDFLTQIGASADTPVRGVRMFRVEEQNAVLVGGYKDMDQARKELDTIKKLRPATAKLYRATYQITRDQNGNQQSKAELVNPFQQAFVAPNPTMPAAKPKANERLDDLVALNDGEPHSLLKCRRPYTLAVMHYQGTSVSVPASVKTDVFSAFKFTKGETLKLAEKQSRELAQALKKLGYEAYVLHTMTASYVTVGGFDRPDDPKLRQLQTQFTTPQSGPLAQLYALKQLTETPMPMPVPKPID